MGDKLVLMSEQMGDPFRAMVDDNTGTLEMDSRFLIIKADGTLAAPFDTHLGTKTNHRLLFH
jgi:hypothetical protein